MRWIAFAGCLFLAGCGDEAEKSVTLPLDQWKCTETKLEAVERTELIAGKVPIQRKEFFDVCVRFERNP